MNDGTIICTDYAAKIMKEVLGYECKKIKVEEAEKKVKELLSSCKKLSDKYRNKMITYSVH